MFGGTVLYVSAVVLAGRSATYCTKFPNTGTVDSLYCSARESASTVVLQVFLIRTLALLNSQASASGFTEVYVRVGLRVLEYSVQSSYRLTKRTTIPARVR